MKKNFFSGSYLKFALLINSLFFGQFTYARSESRLELIKTPESYVTYTTQVYTAGKSFPYRISIQKEISACASLKFKITEMEGFLPSRAVLIVTSTGIASAKVCDAPNQVVSQSFEFPAKKSFVDIIVDADTDVIVDRIE